MINYNPIICVVAFDRPNSLQRLLNSLLKSKNISDTKLIISIDNKAPENYNIVEIAKSFSWPFGEMEIIYQEQRLGLKEHILKCGDLSKIYGSVIILEDDLYVSPFFYNYSCQALNYYDNDSNIAGISLYSQPYEEITELPFKFSTCYFQLQ